MIPPKLLERLWGTLYPDYPLMRGEGYFAVYHDGGLVAADSLAGLAQNLAELNGAPAPDFDISAGVEITLPRRK